MAGGMNRRNNPFAVSLSDRVRSDQPAVPTVDVMSAPPPPDVRHVFVTDELGRRAGLLLRWEKRGDGWWGRVCYPAPYDAEGWALVEDWLPANVIEKA
jgi:hypothetical protein